MQRLFLLLLIPIVASCTGGREPTQQKSISTFDVTAEPIATITSVGIDSLSDSASILRLEPEPDGESVAFLFADPVKGVRAGLGIVQISGARTSQLAWPDSVTSVWWSGPHELSFTAGTGQGVHVVINAHAAQLEALHTTEGKPRPQRSNGRGARTPNQGLTRAQAFIDSVRVQPEGNPQRSTLRYQVDTLVAGTGDTLAAAHVSAQTQSGKVNPAWYLLHTPSGRVRAIDSLIGTSVGLPPSGGQWDMKGVFYYAKERSIWRAIPRAQ
jgi:hypothetical protein